MNILSINTITIGKHPLSWINMNLILAEKINVATSSELARPFLQFSFNLPTFYQLHKTNLF